MIRETQLINHSQLSLPQDLSPGNQETRLIDRIDLPFLESPVLLHGHYLNVALTYIHSLYVG